MIRVVLTVALTVAVVGVTLPAAEQAGVDRSDAAVQSAVDRLVSAGRALSADSDALPGDLAGARRVVELDLPESGVVSAALEWIRLTRVASSRGGGTRISWRVRGGTRRAVRVADLTLRSATSPGRGVVFETGGHRRLVLELVRVEGRRVIRVHRREFKYERGNTPAHARRPVVARDRPRDRAVWM